MAEKTARFLTPEGAREREDPARLRGDEAQLFEDYHERLVRSVGWSVRGDRSLIEDACAFAWQQLIRHQPERTERLYAWLRKVAVREAMLLQHRELRESLPLRAESPETGEPAEAANLGELRAARLDCELAFEAREALRALASLRPRERRYLTLQLAGFSYREIAEQCGATYTNVNKHLARGRARLRALDESERGEAMKYLISETEEMFLEHGPTQDADSHVGLQGVSERCPLPRSTRERG